MVLKNECTDHNSTDDVQRQHIRIPVPIQTRIYGTEDGEWKTKETNKRRRKTEIREGVLVCMLRHLVLSTSTQIFKNG
jgi:hypothetical protein